MRRQVGVVGAGIGGLAVATALARAGHRVIVHERFAESRPVGSGLMLQPTGLAALRRLGLDREVEALGARITRLHGLTGGGRTVFDLAYTDLAPDVCAVAVHRAALHGALWRAFAGSGATLETGRTICGIEPASDGRAVLLDAGAWRSVPFDLAIDASGARSTLRAWVTPQAARPFRYGAVWATVPDAGLAPATLAQRYIAARVMLGLLPLGRAAVGGPPLAALFWSLRPDRHAAWCDGFAAWRDGAAKLWPELAPTLAPLRRDDFTLASYTHFTARVPFRGPVALLGDAAHATSPQLGQGANSALLDALALADAVAATSDIAAALPAYAAARRRHVRFYQLAGLAMTPLFQSDSRAAALLRDATFDPVRRIPWMHREMLRTLAGLKTGLFSHAPAEMLAGLPASPPARTTEVLQRGPCR